MPIPAGLRAVIGSGAGPRCLTIGSSGFSAARRGGRRCLPPRALYLFSLLVGTAAFAGCAPERDGGQNRTLETSTSRMFGSPFAATDGDLRGRAPLVGHWRTDGIELVLVPRLPVAAGEGLPELYGAIPGGPREGIVSLRRLPNGIWEGLYLQARRLERADATITHVSATDSLELTIGAATPVRLRRVGGVNLELLASIAIIGHRGLSLGRADLMNSRTAIERCRLFGCSGVELDVTVPYSVNRQPRPDRLRVYHPPDWRSEITGFDSVPLSAVEGALDLPTALRATRDSGLSFVYLDPKIRWLLPRDRVAARAALEGIVAAASAHLSAQAARQTIAIGSETSRSGEGADLIAELRRDRPWPSGLVWALEITRGTDVDNARARLAASDDARRPDVASFNLLRVRAGGGGFLRVFMSSISEAMERELARAPQPFVYWTAHDEQQFDGALRAIGRTGQGTPREAGIITPYPHRLAFHLATRRRADNVER
jgi:hypothetical protein